MINPPPCPPPLGALLEQILHNQHGKHLIKSKLIQIHTLTISISQLQCGKLRKLAVWKGLLRILNGGVSHYFVVLSQDRLLAGRELRGGDWGLAGVEGAGKGLLHGFFICVSYYLFILFKHYCANFNSIKQKLNSKK